MEEETSAPTLCHPPALGQGSKCSILGQKTTGPFEVFQKWLKKENKHGLLNAITTISGDYVVGIVLRLL